MAFGDKPKKGVDIALVFGKPKKPPMGGSTAPDEDARSILGDAFPGWSDDQKDALREYIMSCMDGSKEPDTDDSDADEEAAPDSSKGY